MSKTYEFSHWVRTLNFEIPNRPAGKGSATMLEMKQILDARMSQGYKLVSVTHLGDNIFYYTLQREKVTEKPEVAETVEEIAPVVDLEEKVLVPPKKKTGRPKKVVTDPAE